MQKKESDVDDERFPFSRMFVALRGSEQTLNPKPRRPCAPAMVRKEVHAAVVDEMALAHASSQSGADGLGGNGVDGVNGNGGGGGDAAAVPRRAGAFADSYTTSSSGAAGKADGALVAHGSDSAAVETTKKDPAEDPSLTDEERFLKSTDALPKSIYGGGRWKSFLISFSLQLPLLVTLLKRRPRLRPCLPPRLPPRSTFCFSPAGVN